MAKLRDRIQDGLDESRILILGSQVVMGLQFHVAFQQRYDTLVRLDQLLVLLALGLFCAAFALLVTPAAYHRLAEGGEDTRALDRLMKRTLRLALPLFFVGLGIDMFIAGTLVGERRMALALGAGLGLGGLVWLGAMEWMGRHHRRHEGAEEMRRDEDEEPTPLKNKIRHVLTETRMALPGAQALLGFQFVAMLTDAFPRLPRSSQWVHLASLVCVALSVALLLSPAPYHRIVEHGEESAHFHRIASRLLLAAIVPLALGVTGDFYVVARKVTGSLPLSLVLAGALLTLLYGLWFGLSLAARRRRQAPPRRSWGRPPVRVRA